MIVLFAIACVLFILLRPWFETYSALKDMNAVERYKEEHRRRQANWKFEKTPD